MLATKLPHKNTDSLPEGGVNKYDVFYTHDQMTPSSTWTINHGLHKFPSVSVIDSAGTVVEGDVSFDSDVLITITFDSAFSGKALLN